jgi:hypothetical protein
LKNIEAEGFTAAWVGALAGAVFLGVTVYVGFIGVMV